MPLEGIAPEAVRILLVEGEQHAEQQDESREKDQLAISRGFFRASGLDVLGDSWLGSRIQRLGFSTKSHDLVLGSGLIHFIGG